jgi:uncharacterized protein
MKAIVPGSLSSQSISLDTARRLALAAQGFARPRPQGRVDRRHLRRAMADMGVIQIDSVNVVARSQELILWARLGPHPRDLIPAATSDGELFEYWVHEASHLPTADHHLHRWKMRGTHPWAQIAALAQRRPGFVEQVRARVEAEGPVVAGDLRDRVGPKGPWWDWDDAKIALEYLFYVGEITAQRRPRDFARVYDLTERVIPAGALATPTPSEAEARRRLLLAAARHLGVGTLEDLADYHRQRRGVVIPLVAELVEEGLLVPVLVESWEQIAYMPSDIGAVPRVSARAVLSPFDPVVWNRDRAERLFGFRYRIEIYTPAAKRRYGYYVMPFLLGTDLVGRFDLKADRGAGQLVVQAAWVEDQWATTSTEADIALAAKEELSAMALWLGLDNGVVVAPKGNLALNAW